MKTLLTLQQLSQTELPPLELASWIAITIIAVAGIYFWYRIVKGEQDAKKVVNDAEWHRRILKQIKKIITEKQPKNKPWNPYKFPEGRKVVFMSSTNDLFEVKALDFVNEYNSTVWKTGEFKFSTKKQQIQKLTDQLQISIQNEDYDQCAVIRDELELLNKTDLDWDNERDLQNYTGK